MDSFGSPKFGPVCECQAPSPGVWPEFAVSLEWGPWLAVHVWWPLLVLP